MNDEERVGKLREDAYEALVFKLAEVKAKTGSAARCLDKGDYFQCAVRLDSLGAHFGSNYMNVLDALSAIAEEDDGNTD